MSSKVIGAVRDVAGIAIILLFPYAGWLPSFTYSIPILLLVWWALNSSGETFRDIGFSFKDFKFESVYIGGITGIILCLILQYLFFPFLELFIEIPESDAEIYDFLVASKWNLVFLILMGWLVGGVYEEIVFHGYIFSRLKNSISHKFSAIISLVLTGILFGAYHYVLGVGGVINATIAGMIYQGIMLYFKGNLWYSVFAHGFYNTTVMLLIYFNYL